MQGIGIVGSTKIAKLLAEMLGENAVVQQKTSQLVAIEDENLQNPISDDAVIHNEKVNLVVVCTEGVTKAYEQARLALELGKHVVTNNQTMVAAYGEKLWRLAADKGAHFRFEAAVLAGVPVLETLFSSLKGAKVKHVYGILNCSCNYILTRMKDTGCSLEDAIEDAVELEYAENDPELDLSGKDSLFKLSLMHTAAFGEWVDMTQFKTASLRHVKQVDTILAQKLGCHIKLLASAKKGQLKVVPTLLEQYSQLGNLSGTLTGVVVESEGAGPLLFAGHGHDKKAIAYALLTDTIQAFSQRQPWQLKSDNLEHQPNAEEKLQRYYVRLPAEKVEKITTAKHIYTIDKKQHAGAQNYIAFVVETGLKREELSHFINPENTEDTCVLNVFRA